MYVASRFGSCAIGMIAGVWLWSHTPGNRVRWWVLIAGWFDAAAIGAAFWPTRAGFFIAHYSVPASSALLLWAVFGWPSGRVERRLIRLPQLATVVSVMTWTLTLVAINATRAPLWGWRTFPVPSIGSRSFGYVLYPLLGTVTVVLDAVIVIALTLRHRRLPRAARVAALPVLFAGVVMRGVATVMWLLVQLGALAGGREGGSGISAFGFSVVLLQSLRFPFVVLLLAVAAGYRGRPVLTGTARSAVVDIGLREEPDVVEYDLAGMLDDPSVRLLLRRDDGTWMTTEGAIARPGVPTTHHEPHAHAPRRGLFNIAGPDGNLTASIEYDADRLLSRTAFEIAAARVELQFLQTLRRAEAVWHLGELRALQQSVIEAQDAARGRLERDLHDGAQQHLVGLLLAGTLLARQVDRTDTHGNDPNTGKPGSAGHDLFAADLTRAAEALRSVVADARPSAIDRGLGAALHVLAASSPVPLRVERTGDIGPNDVLTLPLWLLANEAVTNALKHAAPTRVHVGLRVDATIVTLTVGDDGAGGLEVVPRALARRAEAHGGVAMIDSERGRGTRVTVRIPRPQPDHTAVVHQPTFELSGTQ